MTRCLLSEANLPATFWAEAVNTANYLQNRLPTKANEVTPYELWTGRKPDLSNIKTFGAKAYAYIHKSKRGKLDPKAIEGILIGYDHRSKGYRIYVSDRNVIISRTVKFIEEKHEGEEVPLFSLNEKKNNMSEREDNNSEESNISDEEGPTPVRRSERSNKEVPPDRFSYLAEEAKI
ncbi:copia protein, partial [Lasius niger]